MRLLVHAVGAWIAVGAASGRYPRPLAVGLTMLVSRLGAPTAALTLAGLALKRLDEAGAFESLRSARHSRPPARKRVGKSG